MKPNFTHSEFIKKLEKRTYAQSYPQFPQKNRGLRGEKWEDAGMYVLYNVLKKNLSLKRIDKLDVE